MLKRVPFIDSHTGGEPTRLILDGGPDLGRGTLARRRELFRSRHDRFRSSVACEPRGSEISVGALLCEASRPDRAGGLIFFNNVDTLGMCGHGTIGAVASLAYLGRLRAGRHVFETPVGEVVTELHPDGRVSVANVASYRFRRQVRLGVDGYGTVEGDIAWGGNWFFIIPAPERLPLTAAHVDELTRFSLAVRASLSDCGIHGVDGAEIDHIELTGPSPSGADCRNFVLCPGGAWDRSPCGTGTSARMACLAADGRLAPGEVWRQESLIGSVFEGSYQSGESGRIHPTLTGTAHVMAEGSLILEDQDPFRWGLRR